MLDHLERVAAQSASDRSASALPRGDDLSRGPYEAGAVAAGVLAAQARARRILAGCAGELAGVTAASERVGAALRHSAG